MDALPARYGTTSGLSTVVLASSKMSNGRGSEYRFLMKHVHLTKSNFTRHSWKQAVDIIGRLLQPPYHWRGERAEEGIGRAEVQDVQFATGAQNAVGLAERGMLGRR
jgi:hypothetical protein